MVAFAVKSNAVKSNAVKSSTAGDADTQNRFVAALRVITSAVSLGHDESLIVHVSGDDERARFYPEEFRRYGHLRFSVGLEDPRDLVADLDQALTAAVGPR
jgi:methionine-gamma-lyase